MRKKSVNAVVRFVYLEKMHAYLVVRLTNYGADAIEVRDDGHGIRASDYVNVCASNAFFCFWMTMLIRRPYTSYLENTHYERYVRRAVDVRL